MAPNYEADYGFLYDPTRNPLIYGPAPAHTALIRQAKPQPLSTYYILSADKNGPLGPYTENSKVYVATMVTTATTKSEALAKENPGYAYIVVRAISRAQLQPASVEVKAM